MHRFLVIVVLFLTGIANAQVSVFDCNLYDPLTESAITSGGQLFQQPCILLNNPSGYVFDQNENYILESNSEIHIVPSNFYAGNFTSTGGLNLRIGQVQPTSWDVAVMNYAALTNVQRYDKLELGISLPEPYKTKLDKFIANELNPALNYPASEMINPFLEWELDVEATFTHQTTGEAKTLDAFFTRDMQRNVDTKLWDEIPSNYHMRVRFAPPKTEKWNCVVRIKIDNQLLSESISFPINVVESGKHGYISVHPNKKNFQLDGEVIYPVGQNLPHAIEQSDQELNPAYNLFTKTEFANNIEGWQDYISTIDAYGDLGGRFTRIFMAPWAGLLEWEKKGNYFRRMHQAYELDNVINKMEEHDMFTIFDMLLHNYFMVYADYNMWNWDWDRHMYCESGGCNGGEPNNTRYYPTTTNHQDELGFIINPYNDNPGNYLDPNQHPKMPHEMFTLENDLKYHEQRVRYYISRYGYSTQIYIWEQLEEPFHLDQDGILDGRSTNYPSKTEPYFKASDPLHNDVHAAISNYVQRMNSYVRNHLNHKHQLLGVNAVQRITTNDSIAYHDWSITDPNADCIGMNPYPSYPNELIIDNHEDPDYNIFYTPDENTWLAKVSLLGNNFRNTYPFETNTFPNPLTINDFDQMKRPVYLSECGANGEDWNNKTCMQGTDEKIDNMRFGFTGAAGFNKWHYYMGNDHTVWQSIIRAQNHMNSVDVKNVLGDNFYLQGRQQEELTYNNLQNGEGNAIEMQYYLKSDKTAIAGYVHNRTVNYRTASYSEPCGSPFTDEENQNFNSISNLFWDAAVDWKKLKIGNLPNDADYRIDFYEYPTGNYLFTNYQNTGNNGKFILEFPMLYKDRAVVWFMCYREANRNAIVVNEQVEENPTVDYVFPNPTTDVVNIPADYGDLFLYDALGNTIEISIIGRKEGYVQLDVHLLPKGCYYLKASYKEEIIKFIKL